MFCVSCPLAIFNPEDRSIPQERSSLRAGIRFNTLRIRRLPDPLSGSITRCLLSVLQRATASGLLPHPTFVSDRSCLDITWFCSNDLALPSLLCGTEIDPKRSSILHAPCGSRCFCCRFNVYMLSFNTIESHRWSRSYQGDSTTKDGLMNGQLCSICARLVSVQRSHTDHQG